MQELRQEFVHARLQSREMQKIIPLECRSHEFGGLGLCQRPLQLNLTLDKQEKQQRVEAVVDHVKDVALLNFEG